MVRAGLRATEVLAGLEYLSRNKFTGQVAYRVEANEMRRDVTEVWGTDSADDPPDGRSADPVRAAVGMWCGVCAEATPKLVALELTRVENLRMRISSWCLHPSAPMTIYLHRGRVTKVEV